MKEIINFRWVIDETNIDEIKHLRKYFIFLKFYIFGLMLGDENMKNSVYRSI